jgi:hypothetical protein
MGYPSPPSQPWNQGYGQQGPPRGQPYQQPPGGAPYLTDPWGRPVPGQPAHAHPATGGWGYPGGAGGHGGYGPDRALRQPWNVIMGAILTYFGSVPLILVGGFYTYYGGRISQALVANPELGRVLPLRFFTSFLAIGVPLLILAVTLIVLAAFAQRGRNGARVGLTAVGAVFLATMLYVMVAGGLDAASTIVFVLVPMLYVIAVLVLFWVGRCNAWYRAAKAARR